MRRANSVRCVTCVIGTVLFSAAFLPSVEAQSVRYPTKPVRVILPFSAGGPIEAPARSVTQKLTEAFGQAFAFDYRTGASGSIGTEIVARAPRDGYTMLITNCAHTQNAAYYKKLPYDPVDDFAAISQLDVTYGNLLVVHPSVPVHSLKEFVALAKSRPGALKYASAGIGSPPHVTAALFATMSGIDLLHVPYKGTSVAFNDVLGGHVEAMTVHHVTGLQYVQTGRLRALGLGGPRRHPLFPQIPTFDEFGLKGFDVTCYHGAWFPAGTPGEIVTLMNAQIVKALATPEVRKAIDDAGYIPVGNTPQEFTDFNRKDVARQKEILKLIGLEPQ